MERGRGASSWILCCCCFAHAHPASILWVYMYPPLSFYTCLAGDPWKCCLPREWLASKRDLAPCFGICISSLASNDRQCKERERVRVCVHHLWALPVGFYGPLKIDTPCSTRCLAAHCIYNGDDDDDDDDYAFYSPLLSPAFIVWFSCLLNFSSPRLRTALVHCYQSSCSLSASLHLLSSSTSAPLSSLPLHLILFSLHPTSSFLSPSPPLPASPPFCLCCFCSDAVIGLSILILSCQCRAVHSELQLPTPPDPPPSLPLF